MSERLKADHPHRTLGDREISSIISSFEFSEKSKRVLLIMHPSQPSIWAGAVVTI